MTRDKVTSATKMVKSPLSDIHIPNFPLHQLAFQKFEAHGNKVALVSCIHLKFHRGPPCFLHPIEFVDEWSYHSFDCLTSLRVFIFEDFYMCVSLIYKGKPQDNYSLFNEFLMNYTQVISFKQ